MQPPNNTNPDIWSDKQYRYYLYCLDGIEREEAGLTVDAEFFRDAAEGISEQAIVEVALYILYEQTVKQQEERPLD